MTLAFLWAGCQTLRNSPKYSFAEGYYSSRLYHKKRKKVYIVPSDDSIRIYSAKRISRGADTALKLAFPPNARPATFNDYNFRQLSLDFDVLNLLCKFRPSQKGFPPQFNNNILNAALYLGRRADVYQLRYRRTPLGADRRTITHYGYSFGVFAGFGGAHIDEYVTRNALAVQYDGLVQIAGVAAIVGIDRVNFGLNIGVDHLLDGNRRLWIYQGKPWLGVSIGLNLN